MTSKPKRSKQDFVSLNASLTKDVLDRLTKAGRRSAVIAEAPPGAGKSTLTASVARSLIGQDSKLRVAIVTQTNEQSDDLVAALIRQDRELRVARMVGSTGGPSSEIVALSERAPVVVCTDSDPESLDKARIVVSTARKWQYERARLQRGKRLGAYPFALIDEAYQMRSDMLLGIADLFETLFCVGDPGQLDPFTVIDDSIWKGLPHSPSRTALGTLRAFHPTIEPLQLPTSWRLPPSAAKVVAEAFYPFGGFEAGTRPEERSLTLGRSRRKKAPAPVDADAVLQRAATTGWAYLELPERFTVRTDDELATALAQVVDRLLDRSATVVDERSPKGRELAADRVAIVAAHNDQVHAVRYALSQLDQDPDSLTVSTANKIQGREYDVVFVWHPLAGRRDATAFHLEAGRMCVMLSRHRQACVVVGRAGASKLLEDFPDADPIFLDEPEKFPDGWEANHRVLQHLATCRVD